MLILIAQAASTVEAESSGLGALGLDASALVFQLLNFAALLLLLRVFAYKPILRILDARRQKIDEGLRNALEIEQLRRDIAAEQQQTIAEARRQAEAIMSAGQQQAASLLKASEAQAKAQAERIKEQTAATLEHDLKQARHALKQDLLSLVALATEKVTRQKIDSASDTALVSSVVQDLEKTLPE